MGYKMDIPTLSANEVYTLTFEYEGEETIQLTVGDQTLETTDRRVVFTTTSPVNYIESNVKLENLDLYEGYYESDDQDGEYTQESYIEGRSSVNLKSKDSCFLADNWYQKVEMLEDGYRRISHVANDRDISCFYLLTDSNNFAKELKGEKYTIILDIRKNTFPSDVAINFGLSYNTSDSYEKIDDDIFNAGDRMCKQILGGQTGRAEIVIRNTTVQTTQVPSRYWGTISGVSSTTDGTNLINTLNGRTDFNGCILEYMITVIEGDYYGQGVKPFKGIGCVKSPTIVSHEDSNNLFHIKDYTCTVNNGTIYSKNGKISFSGSFNGYTNIDIIEGGAWNDKSNCYYEAGTYYLKAHYKTIKPRPNNDTYTANFVFVCEDGTSRELIGMPNVAMGGTFNTVQQNTLTVTSPIVKIYYKIWYGRTRDWVTIENVSISKVDREYVQGEENNAILDTSVVFTPNDLELHAWKDSKGTWVKDKLDLTTGTCYQYYDMWDLGTLLSQNGPLTGFGYNLDTNTVYVQYNIGNTHPSGTVWGGQGGFSALIGDYFEYGYGNANYQQKTSPYIAFFNKYLYLSGMSYSKIFNGVTILDKGNALNRDEAVSALIKFATDNNLRIGLPLNTPKTKQIDIKPLKSYRNGSITTSSQQLTPTLKTTLPISNKFTQTDLTTGSTYNIYFDGTATSLNCGGTIVDSPTSPCQVKCGDTTTLTIDGEVTNVRVLETSVQNKVGNVCGKADVELAKIIAYEHDNIASNVRYSKNSYGYLSSIKLDNANHSFTVSGGHSSSHGSVNTGINYPSGISLVYIECDITMPSENLMANIHFGNGVWSGYQNFQNVTLNSDTSTIKQATQTININNSNKSFFSTVVTGGHYSNLMYVVSKNNVQTDESLIITVSTMTGQTLEGYTGVGGNGVTISNLRVKVMENYPNITTLDNVTSVLRENDGSTIIWEDMDLTFIQNISNLEQPIKLRSLGNVYDSYNLATGILTKRIGVSETDGSYSVLSSPIVENISMGIPITNLITNTFPITGFTNFSGNFKPNTTYTVFLDIGAVNGETASGFVNNSGAGGWGSSQYSYTVGKQVFTRTTDSTTGGFVYRLRGNPTINSAMIIEGDLTNYDLEYFIGTKQLHVPPHLYTNGQVKVYSESDVYPTTILNGQSTNNYAINELNTYNNYTIRYDGECESINLATKSNTQGTNRIVKAGATSGNLTFVNDSGDIDNVLLVEHDVREQEINHFNGLQTVEVSRMLIENQRNMWSQDFIMDTTLTANYKRISKDYIKVVPNETLYCNIGQTRMDYCDIIQYNENKERVTSTQIFGWSTSGMYQDKNNIYKNKVQLSENTHYIRICIHQAFLTTASVSRGDFLPPSTLAYNQYQGQYIDLPQPVQLNRIHKENMPYGSWSNVLGQNVKLADGIAYDSYNPITGEYIQRVYKMTLNGDDGIKYIDNWSATQYAIDDNTLPYPRKKPHLDTVGRHAGLIDVDGVPYGASYNAQNDIFITWLNLNNIAINLPRKYTNNVFNQNACKQWLRENPIVLFYELETPITTQLTPINIPTFENGTLQLITTDGKVFPMIEYSMPTTNRYNTSMWSVGSPITHRNATEIYINGSTTPTTPTETMTFTKEQLSSGSIVINDNGDGLMVLNGDYTGRDIPYFTGMRSVESIEIETSGNSDQPLFGKGGRR